MAEDKDLLGQSFDNPALTGSGTILDDGTYGDNLPDPTQVRGLGPRRTAGGRLLPDLPSTEVADALRPPTPGADAAAKADAENAKVSQRAAKNPAK